MLLLMKLVVVNVKDDDKSESENGKNHPDQDRTRYTDIAATTILADSRYRRMKLVIMLQRNIAGAVGRSYAPSPFYRQQSLSVRWDVMENQKCRRPGTARERNGTVPENRSIDDEKRQI